MHADKAARVAEEDSETPYMTRRAMDFITEAEADGRPWCLHLSYIKPHWPYIAPEPYASMYGPGDVLPAVRSEQEKQIRASGIRAPIWTCATPATCRATRRGRKSFRPIWAWSSRSTTRWAGWGVYVDARARRLFENTMIVFSSDHGDYLGDHWMGEKDLFHDALGTQIPLIVYDPGDRKPTRPEA